MVHPALIIIPLALAVGGMIGGITQRERIENNNRIQSQCRYYANDLAYRSKRFVESYVGEKSVNKFVHPRFKRWERSYFFQASCDELEQYYNRRYNTKHMDDWRHSVKGVTYAGEFRMGHGYPLVVHAVIHNQNIEGPRSTFTGLDEQMRYMNYWFEDEKGHIVASQLGGPATWWNLAPQTARVNRNVGGASGWINNENSMKKFLQNNCGHIEYTVILNYEGTSRRPSAFKMCFSFRDENNNLVRLLEVDYDNTY